MGSWLMPGARNIGIMKHHVCAVSWRRYTPSMSSSQLSLLCKILAITTSNGSVLEVELTNCLVLTWSPHTRLHCQASSRAVPHFQALGKPSSSQNLHEGQCGNGKPKHLQVRQKHVCLVQHLQPCGWYCRAQCQTYAAHQEQAPACNQV